MDVTVTVGTFGTDDWVTLAQERAIPSAQAQGVAVIHRHADTLAAARNAALAEVRTEWVVVCDADDELEPGYVEAMSTGTCDLRAPAVRYVRGGRARTPYVPRVAGHRHECSAECIASGAGNWLVIGTVARAELLRDVGGWRDWPVYEDYDLWMRAVLAGATVEAVPGAVYRAYARANSRNRAPATAEKNAVHMAINAANLPSGVLA